MHEALCHTDSEQILVYQEYAQKKNEILVLNLYQKLKCFGQKKS